MSAERPYLLSRREIPQFRRPVPAPGRQNGSAGGEGDGPNALRMPVERLGYSPGPHVPELYCSIRTARGQRLSSWRERHAPAALRAPEFRRLGCFQGIPDPDDPIEILCCELFPVG